MNRRDLDRQLDQWLKELPQKDRKQLLVHLSGLKSVYPFNEYEYRLMFLLNKKTISFSEYESLRNAYVNEGTYLDLFNIAPRIFGETWAQQHLMAIDSRFKKPSKSVDKNYDGDYDLFTDKKDEIIKVEVKASRAINTKARGTLEAKALWFNSKEPFWMNFQQLKSDSADVFIFIGVWVDRILYWVLSKKEVKRHPSISHQHRGGIEFQIGITDKNMANFKKFLVPPKRLIEMVRLKA